MPSLLYKPPWLLARHLVFSLSVCLHVCVCVCVCVYVCVFVCTCVSSQPPRALA